jgi:ABC-2 type transport system ATP-binding protein
MNAIEITHLAKNFRRNHVLNNVCLAVPQGQTFAFLGRNGEGKATTIRMMLGLLKPSQGEVNILGLDPQRDALEIRQRIGYLAEDQQMWGWMTVQQIIRFMAPFYPTWDHDLAAQYLDSFELPKAARINHLSKGQNARLGLLLALAHRPEMVILDDPTLGLDPIMRKQFLRDVVEHLQGSGVTVFFSSHLLYEIEAVADQVAILHQGRIIKQVHTEQLREKVKRLIFPIDQNVILPSRIILDIQRSGRQQAITVEDVDVALAAVNPGEVIDLNLDEIFEAYVIGKPDIGTQPTAPLERVA